MRVMNRYVPSGVSSSPVGLSSFGTVGGKVGSSSPTVSVSSRHRQQQEVATFIEEFGRANLPFETSTGGSLLPGDRQPIQRGFVRRAARNPANPLSDMSLRFMYNPEKITRQYASYLEQAAIDPFNTVFQSGNLVAPPSIIEFSFSLVFDRQVEATARGPWTSKADWANVGVLHDMAFFDAVLRNVPPGGTPNTVPDNGVMMVNPEDVTVVFSKDLTVQGKPTNSQVRFTKFLHNMVPVRCEMDITLLINYFGPLREPFGLDARQQIAAYQALIPYGTTLGDGLANTRSVEEAVRVFRSSGSAASLLAAAVNTSAPQATPWWNGSSSSTSSGGVANTLQMTTPVNNTIASNALMAAQQLFAQSGGPRYDQGRRTQHGAGKPTPWYWDCSSFIWKAFQTIGAQGIFGKSTYPTTATMLDFWNSSGWTTVQKVLTWQSTSGVADRLTLLAKPGDLLFRRSGGNGHIAMVVSVSPGRIRTIEARGKSVSPQAGEFDKSATSVASSFNYLLRPALAGAQGIGGGK
jgi:hypothetical protein